MSEKKPVITEESKREYKQYLTEDLSKRYAVKPEKAKEIVEASVVAKMLDDGDDAAIFQMHEPYDYTLEEIVDEYLQRCEKTVQEDTVLLNDYLNVVKERYKQIGSKNTLSLLKQLKEDGKNEEADLILCDPAYVFDLLPKSKGIKEDIPEESKQRYIAKVYQEFARRGFSEEEIPKIISKTGFWKVMEEFPREQLHYSAKDAVDELIETALHSAISEE